MDIVAVGSRVRVLDERSEFANVGMISVVDEANHTADIMYDNEKLNEECQVSFGRLRFLEPWEEDVVPSRDPNELKEFGNTLFTLKDFTAAMKLYQRAIKEIDAMLVPSVGGNVLISENGDVQMGMISSDLDNDQYEVLLTNNEDEKIYPKSALICLPAEQSLLLLLRSVYMNLSRCAMKKSFKGWAVHYTSMAIAIVQTMLTDSTDRHNNASATSTELQKQLNDGLYLRAKALLTACRPARAKLDAQQLRINGDVKRAEQLEKEISTFKQQRQKQDRRLAKDIAAWIDTAMSTQQQEGKKKKLSLSSATAGAFDEDEDFTLDEDEDEGNEDEAQTDQSKQQKDDIGRDALRSHNLFDGLRQAGTYFNLNAVVSNRFYSCLFKLEIFKYLGADFAEIPNLKSAWTILGGAILREQAAMWDEDSIDRLLEATGLEVDSRGKTRKRSLLIRLSEHGSIAAISYLLDLDEDLNLKD